MRSLRSLLLLAGLGVLLAACGDGDGPSLDTGNPQLVFRASMAAVHDGDWPTLETLLTKDARQALEKDMRRLQKNLATPRPGSQLKKDVERILGERAKEDVARAVAGQMPEMLRFFVKLSPRGREPAQRGVQLDPKTGSMTFVYELDNGERRHVKVVQARGRWYVADIQL